MPRSVLTRTALFGALTLLLMLFGATPAGAHGVLDEAGPILVGNLHSQLTERTLPAGVSVDLLENGYVLRVVNHSATELVANVAETDSAGSDAEPPRIPAGAIELWAGAPSAVTDEDVHAAKQVKAGDQVRAWTVELTGADGSKYAVGGVIDRRAAPSPAWLVVGVLAILLVVGLLVLLRPARPAADQPSRGRSGRLLSAGLLACAVVGLAVETAATLLARAAGEGTLEMVREYLPQIGACLLGVVAGVLVWRGHRLAAVLAMIAALVFGAGVVTRWPLLWSSVAISRLPIAVDRVLTLAVSAAALSVALLVMLGVVSEPSTAEPAPVE